MKKLFLLSWPWIFGFMYQTANAQDDQKKKEKEEIIISKNGDKDVNLSIQINGDKITVNGKPLSEFNEADISVNKRKFILRENNRMAPRSNKESDNMTWGPDGQTDNLFLNNDDGVSKAFLGVTTEKTSGGAKITEEVLKSSAAGKAGLMKGDIITRLDDQQIDGPQSLYDAVIAKQPKDEVKISYKREGKDKSTKAVLQERKASFTRSYSFSTPDGSYKTFTMPAMPPQAQGWDGIDPENFISPEAQERLENLHLNFGSMRRPKLGLKIQDTEEGNGVKILEVEDSSAAAIAGLKKDDVISEIGGKKVMNTDEAREQLLENSEKAKYPLKARRNGNEMSFEIKIPKKLKTANL